MKLFFINVLALFAIVNLYSSCKKDSWYEEKVDKSQSIPKSLDDLFLLVSDADRMNTTTPYLGEWGSDQHRANEPYFSFLSSYLKSAYTWSNEFPYTQVVDWGGNGWGAYPRIFVCNLVLELLQGAIPLNNLEQEKWNDVKGQALFIRAKSFYELAQIFAPPYSSSTLESLSIPLRLESDINIASKRSSVQETYKQIIDDLKLSKHLLRDDLPTTPYFKSKPSRITVDALLARIYLSMEEYEAAGKYADTCLSKYADLIDFNTLDINMPLPFTIFNKEVIYHTIMGDRGNPLLFFVDSTLFKSYRDNDLRKNYFYDNSNGNEFIIFKGTYDSYNGFCFSGLTTDETYLIRAESYARSGNILKAMEDLNTLLKSRWRNSTPYIPIEASSSVEALEHIILERERELIFRGTRWSDLRRLNRDPRFQKTLTRTFNGKTYTIEPNSYKYTFPIPDDVIRASGMEQNMGWK